MEQSGAKAAFRGSHPAKIDDKGRLKIPTPFRALIEASGRELFVTSRTGEDVLIYPMPAWLALEERLSRMPSTHPVRVRLLERVNYFGQSTELDSQGRVVLPQRLRESAAMNGEVDVLGTGDHLNVWNHERFLARLARQPFTPDDDRTLSEFGV